MHPYSPIHSSLSYFHQQDHTDHHPNLMWISWLLNLREYNPVKTTKARLDNFTVATLVNLYIKIKQTSNLIYS